MGQVLNSTPPLKCPMEETPKNLLQGSNKGFTNKCMYSEEVQLFSSNSRIEGTEQVPKDLPSKHAKGIRSNLCHTTTELVHTGGP